MQAMLKKDKLDINGLQQAYNRDDQTEIEHKEITHAKH